MAARQSRPRLRLTPMIPARVSGEKPVAHDLLDLSAVPVPGDPGALMERQRSALATLRDDLDAVLREDEADIVLPCESCGEAVPSPDWASGAWCDECAVTDEGERTTAYDEPCCSDCALRSADVTYSASIDVDALAEQLLERLTAGEVEEPEPSGDDPHSIAAAMVACFDRGSDDTDAERERAYRALVPKYRRLGWETPEFIPLVELRSYDDENWRAIFLAGELSRVGKTLSARNERDLVEGLDKIEAGVEQVRKVIDRARPADEDESRAVDTKALELLSSLGDF